MDPIAVLPFSDLSGSTEDDYFSDGLAEELLNLLARIDGLKVSARTSSFAFKGRNLDVRAIGDSLDVGTVLEGSVRRDAQTVRITAQLYDYSALGFSMNRPELLEPRRWTVLDSSGRLLGELTTPPNFMIHQIGADWILGVWRDELDIQYVRQYALSKPAG